MKKILSLVLSLLMLLSLVPVFALAEDSEPASSEMEPAAAEASDELPSIPEESDDSIAEESLDEDMQITEEQASLVMSDAATASENMAPSNLSVSPATATVGNTVTLSFKLGTNPLNILKAYAVYKKPISGGVKAIDASYSFLKGYTASMEVTEDTENGEWSLYSIVIVETSILQSISLEGLSLENFSLESLLSEGTLSEDLLSGDLPISIYLAEGQESLLAGTNYQANYCDFSAGKFTVTGANDNPDVTGPQLKEGSLSVSSTTATVGDTVTLRFQLEDESETINYALVTYKKPVSAEAKPYIAKNNSESGYWEVQIEITEETELGDWIPSSMVFVDKNLNYTLYTAEEQSGTDSGKIYQDFSAVKFEVIEASDVIGDTDGDNNCNIQDLTHYIKFLFDSSVGCHVKSDFTGNGTNDIADAIRLLRYIADSTTDLYTTE